MKKAVANTWWSRMTPKQQKLIMDIAIGSGITLVAATALYFGVRFFKKKIGNHERGKGFGESSHATWADQIRNGILNDGVWLGTDVPAIRKAMIEIPSKQDFEKVKKSYKRQFNSRNLVDDLRGDLSTTEFDEMLAIIQSKPEKAKDAGVPIYDPHGWAKRLNAAVNYETWGFLWGTDIDAITAVVNEIPTVEAYQETAKVYYNEYGVALLEDLKGDLSLSELQKYAKMIAQKPLK